MNKVLTIQNILHEEKRKRADAALTQAYESKFIPKAIVENRYAVDPEHFTSY